MGCKHLRVGTRRGALSGSARAGSARVGSALAVSLAGALVALALGPGSAVARKVGPSVPSVAQVRLVVEGQALAMQGGAIAYLGSSARVLVLSTQPLSCDRLAAHPATALLARVSAPTLGAAAAGDAAAGRGVTGNAVAAIAGGRGKGERDLAIAAGSDS